MGMALLRLWWAGKIIHRKGTTGKERDATAWGQNTWNLRDPSFPFVAPLR
jgi:hypothetical protein